MHNMQGPVHIQQMHAQQSLLCIQPRSSVHSWPLFMLEVHGLLLSQLQTLTIAPGSAGSTHTHTCLYSPV